jgi:hypothetical protein
MQGRGGVAQHSKLPHQVLERAAYKAAPPLSAGRAAAKLRVGTARVCRGIPQARAPQGQRGLGRPDVPGAAGPNKGVQATVASVRSCLAPAAHRA